jgi:hypothetical protein
VPAAAASSHDQFITGGLHVAQHVAAVAIADDCSRGHLDHQVGATASEAVGTLPVFAAVCFPMALVRKVSEVRVTI